MKKHIESRADIELLVKTFYSKATTDELIGHFFTKIVALDFGKHLPVMYDFWESVLFQNAKYQGNPMHKHFELDRLSRLDPVHFQRWLKLWKRTVNDLFEGEKAETAKKRAKMIANLMEYKVQRQRDLG